MGLGAVREIKGGRSNASGDASRVGAQKALAYLGNARNPTAVGNENRFVNSSNGHDERARKGPARHEQPRHH